jgi:hypothetical protein
LKTRPPYTIIAFAAFVGAVLVELLVRDAGDRELLTYGPVLALASFALVLGIWFAWLFLTTVAAGDLVYAAFTWPGWETVAINGIMLVLLLARPTRRYARIGRPRFRAWFKRGQAA